MIVSTRALRALFGAEPAVCNQPEAARKAEEFARAGDAASNIYNSLLLQARAHRRLDQAERAFARATDAINLYDERLRPGFLGDPQRTRVEGIINTAHDLLVGSLLDLHRPIDALQQAERARSRVLLDLVATQFARTASHSSKDADFDLEQQLDERHEALAEVQRRIGSAVASTDRDKLLRRRSPPAPSSPPALPPCSPPAGRFPRIIEPGVSWWTSTVPFARAAQVKKVCAKPKPWPKPSGQPGAEGSGPGMGGGLGLDRGSAVRSRLLICCLAILVGLGLAGSAQAQPNRTEPGPEAAMAQALFESESADDKVRGCEHFLELVEADSADPWAFRGAALCAALVDGFRADFENVLARGSESPHGLESSQRPESAERLFARGYLAFFDQDFGSAERLLRAAVDAEPRMAVAWNTLGVVRLMDRRYAEASTDFDRALELTPHWTKARDNRERVRIYTEVFERLRQRLENTPSGPLPDPPCVPASGRRPNEVLVAGDETAMNEASQLLATLQLMPLDQRSAWLRTRIAEGGLSEHDLWHPSQVAQGERLRHAEGAATTLEAQIQLAEACGRADVLLWAVSDAVRDLRPRYPPETIAATFRPWTRLDLPEEAKAAKARAIRIHASLLLHAGQPEAAIEAQRRARGLYEALGDRLGEARTWEEEAEILILSGHNEDALHTYRKARSLAQARGETLLRGNFLQGEAHVLIQLGRHPDALRTFHEARALFEEVDDPLGLGNTWLGEGQILFLSQRYEPALDAYRKAKRTFEALGAKLSLGNALLGEARALYFTDRSEDALAAYRRARALFEELGETLGLGISWLGEGEILLQQFRFRDALEAASKAEHFAKAGGARWNIHNAVLLQARAHRYLEQHEKVVERTEAAIDLYDEQLRAGLFDDAPRIQGENIVHLAHDLLIGALLELGRPAEALEKAEQARARVLLDLVTRRSLPGKGDDGDDGEDGDGGDDGEQRIAELHGELAEVRQQLDRATESESRSPWLNRRQELDLEIERLEFERLLASDARFETTAPASLADMQALADAAGPVLVYYSAFDRALAAWLEPGKPLVIHTLELARADLDRQAKELVEFLANPNYGNRFRKPARALAEQLLTPFLDRLPESGPLLVVPHGPLHQVPFQTLVTADGRLLGERLEITVVPSFSTLTALRERHRPTDPRDPFFAMASGRGLAAPLGEIRAIGELFDAEHSHYLEPAKAHFSGYWNGAPRARHLLIASQGVHEPNSRRDTYLEIEPSERHDHRLTAAEIAAIPLEAELVTLAACDTARGDPLLSDERLDLTRAFLTAGSAAVLATRWKVPEGQVTSRFLMDFYRAYRQGGPDGQGLRKDEALAEAERRSRKRRDPAQVWAAWVLIGDPR